MSEFSEVLRGTHDKICAYSGCGRPLVRRDGERGNKYRARVCCDLVCARRYQAEVVKARQGGTAPCVICNSPVKANKRGRGNMSLTCGSAECLSEVQKQVAGRRAEAIHWPAVEEPVAVPDFSAHNLKFKPALGSVRVNAEDRQSYSGCSAAWTAGV